MGEGNIAEVAAARNGRERLAAYCRDDADGIMAARPVQLADAFARSSARSVIDSSRNAANSPVSACESAGLAAGVEELG